MTTEKNKGADNIIEAFAKSIDMRIETKQVGDTVKVSVSYIPLDVEIDTQGNIIKQYEIDSIEELDL